jgi:hypothetical protein
MVAALSRSYWAAVLLAARVTCCPAHCPGIRAGQKHAGASPDPILTFLTLKTAVLHGLYGKAYINTLLYYYVPST